MLIKCPSDPLLIRNFIVNTDQLIMRSYLSIISTLLLLFIGLSAMGQTVPTNYYPKNGQILNGTITLKWNIVANASSYAVEYANNSSFTGSTVVNSLTQANYTLPAIPGGSYYYWRVRAQTPQGNTAWSNTYSFGNFVPSSFPDIVFWVSADGSVTKDASNNVSEWVDMSSNSNNVTQPTAASQPLWQANTLNGHPVIKFDGTNDFMSGGDILDIGETSRSIFFIGQTYTSAGAYLAKNKPGNFQDRYTFLYSGGQFYAPLWQDQTEINNVIPRAINKPELVSFTANRDTTSPYYVTRLFNADSAGLSYYRYNLLGTGHNMDSPYRFLLGGTNNTNDNGQNLPLNGYLAEVVMYNSAFPDSVKNIVERTILDKYAPPVDLGADISLTTSFCDTMLKAGKNFIHYSWSTGVSGAADSTLVATDPGIYSVTATDLFGRKTIDTLVLTKPDPNFYDTPTLCYNDSITWDTKLAKSLYSFEWTGGSTDSFLTVTSGGTYRVTVTDLNSCTRVSAATSFNVDSFAFNVNIISAADTSLCSGNIIGLSQGAGLVQSYQWSTNSSAPFIAVDTSGAYKLTVTNTLGCVAIDTAVINILGQGPTPDFVADPVCIGSPTQFTDLSSIASPNFVNDWLWDFGGGNTSTLQNPQYTFADTGLHIVTLRSISDQGCSSSPISKLVVVYPEATSFFADSIGCINLPVNFESLATAPSGSTITNSDWDFGDGNFSTLADPSHTYNAAGTYNVTLTVTTDKGCQTSYTRPVTIVASAPTPGPFSLKSPTNGTNLTASTIQFVWTASTNRYSYQLEVSTNSNFSNIIFSSTTTDTSLTTSAIPSTLGQYYWRVRAINVCNASSISSTRNFYRISPSDLPALTFWVTGDGSLIKNSSNFVSNWFDQSSKSNHVYQLNSVKQPRWVDSLAKINYMPAIKFSGTNALEGGNILNLGKKSRTIIIVGQMDASTTSGTYIAKSLAGPQPDRYAILRSNGQLYNLHHDQFDRSIISTTPYGQFETIICQTKRAQGELTLQRNYGPTLTGLGIADSSRDMSSTYRFLVGAYNSNPDVNEQTGLSGYIAEIIIFDTILNTDQLTAIKLYLDSKYTRPVNLGPDINIDYGYCDKVMLDASERYITYNWSTGDTTNTLDVTLSGTYSVTVVDAFGNISSDTVVVNVPSLLPPPRLSFCDQDSIIWNVDQGPAYNYLWSTGDTTPELVIKQSGTVSVLISDTIPASQGGPCYISASYTFVADSFSITTTLGPDTTLCSGAELGLKNNTQAVSSYLWSTNVTSPTIVVQNSDTYWVQVTNQTGCQASDTINVTVSGALANVDFTLDQTACLGDTSFFFDQSTVQAPYNILENVWTYGDTSLNDTTTNGANFYTSDGAFNVTLSVKTDSNCVASTTKSLIIFEKPVANFNYEIGCAGAPFVFRDRSTSPTNDPIAQYDWDFGDSGTASTKNPTHVYTTDGEYVVSLSITSTAGCTSVFTDTITVYPEVNAEIGANNLCFGQTVQFYNAGSSLSITSYFWEFGDNDFSFDEAPTHNYAQEGTKVVRLTVVNALGCELTVTDTITISEAPVAAFENTEACEGLPMQFTDITNISGQDSIVTWLWEFGDSSFISRLPNPLHVYDTAGTYTVTLHITSANGCTDQVTQQVTVAAPPIAGFSFDPEYGQSPLLVDFTDESANAVSYFWDFGDGDTSTLAEPMHTYLENGNYTITQSVTGIGGCVSTSTQQISVIVTTLNISVSLVETIDDNGRLYLSALIGNKGTRDVTSFEIMSTIGKGSRIAEHVDTLLPSGRSMFYRFRSSYVTSEAEAGSYICIEAYEPNGEQDDEPSDNKQCVTLEDILKVVPVYPNPASDFITLDLILPADDNLVIDLYDTYGHELLNAFDGPASKGLNSYTIDIRPLPSGVYLLRINYQGERSIEKFVIEK